MFKASSCKLKCPTGARQETFLGKVGWVKTMGTGGDCGRLESRLCFLRVGAAAAAGVTEAWWQCRPRVA